MTKDLEIDEGIFCNIDQERHRAALAEDGFCAKCTIYWRRCRGGCVGTSAGRKSRFQVDSVGQLCIRSSVHDMLTGKVSAFEVCTHFISMLMKIRRGEGLVLSFERLHAVSVRLSLSSRSLQTMLAGQGHICFRPCLTVEKSR